MWTYFSLRGSFETRIGSRPCFCAPSRILCGPVNRLNYPHEHLRLTRTTPGLCMVCLEIFDGLRY
jgi:hypothetical protein